MIGHYNWAVCIIVETTLLTVQVIFIRHNTSSIHNRTGSYHWACVYLIAHIQGTACSVDAIEVDSQCEDSDDEDIHGSSRFPSSSSFK